MKGLVFTRFALVVGLLVLGVSSNTQAAQTSLGETVGGPLLGDCRVLVDQTVVNRFYFEIGPASKAGVRIDDGSVGFPGLYFIEIINDSYENKLSIAAVSARDAIANPPRLCRWIRVERRTFSQCDYIQPEAQVPRAPALKDEELEVLPLVGSLKFEMQPKYRGYATNVVDSWQATIRQDNASILDAPIELTIGDRKVTCEINYLNLF
jgi:hypothetical protein